MKRETKLSIVEAAGRYCREQGWVKEESGETGLNKLAEASGLSATYLSPMMQGVFEYKNARTGKLHPILDEHFETLAKAVSYSYQKEYWAHRDSKEFREIIFELTQAKEEALNRTIIAESGFGKSYTLELFKRKAPIGTWIIKCFRGDTLNDLLRKIETEMRIKGEGSSSQRVDRVALEFYRNRRNRPILIIDEAEALSLSTFAMLKALYDAFSMHKGIALVGTPDLLDTMERAKLSKRPGMPQFYRRFKSGIRHIQHSDDRYSLFLDSLDLSRDFKRLLCSISDNYGELHDYLEPAMRKADEIGVEFTEEFFKNYHRL